MLKATPRQEAWPIALIEEGLPVVAPLLGISISAKRSVI